MTGRIRCSTLRSRYVKLSWKHYRHFLYIVCFFLFILRPICRRVNHRQLSTLAAAGQGFIEIRTARDLELQPDKTLLQTIKNISLASTSDASTIFDKLISSYSIPLVVTLAREFYRGRELELAAKLQSAESIKDRPLQVHTIGIYYPQLFHGGIERVISLQIQMFLEMQFEVVLFTNTMNETKEYPIPTEVHRVILPDTYEKNRAYILYEGLKAYKVDVLIYHAHITLNLLFDLLLSKTLGTGFIIVRHGTVVHYFSDKGSSRTRTYYKIYRLANKVLVLSKMEEAFLNLMCVNAEYLPNPIQFPDITPQYEKNEGIILWVGRLSQGEKNYLAALKIISKVVQTNPDAQLVLVGPAEKSSAGRDLNNFISQNNLERNVKWIGDSHNVSTWYKKAKIHLLTSPYESFPMVIVESKSYAIPLVTFDLPYVELLRDGKGVISVAQNDIDEAARAISNLLNNETLCHLLSVEAYNSLQPFRTFDQYHAWRMIFNDLGKPSDSCDNRIIPFADMKLLVDVLLTESANIRGGD